MTLVLGSMSSNVSKSFDLTTCIFQNQVLLHTPDIFFPRHTLHYTCPDIICTLQHHCSVFVCNYNQHHILQLLKHSQLYMEWSVTDITLGVKVIKADNTSLCSSCTVKPLDYNINNCLFIFSVYFEGSPPGEEPWGIMPGGDPPVLICSHIPTKKGHFRAWWLLYLWVLLRFRNTLRLTHSGGPPSGKPTHTGTSPTTYRTIICLFFLAVLGSKSTPAT
jgi:hypothetical protein